MRRLLLAAPFALALAVPAAPASAACGGTVDVNCGSGLAQCLVYVKVGSGVCVDRRITG